MELRTTVPTPRSRDVLRQRLYDGLSHTDCPLSVATRRSGIGVSRHRLDRAQNTLASAPPQDAYLIVVQLKDQPAHDFWEGDRHVTIPAARSGTLSVADLRYESQALFTSEIDSLHIHLPRAALEDLAIDTAARPITDIVIEGEWKPDDHVAHQLAPLLAAAVEASPQAAQSYIDHVVLAMATHMAVTYGGMGSATIGQGTLAPWQIARAQEMLSAEAAGDMSLSDVANACGLSVSYFSRAFKVSTGMAPHAWLLARRVDRARGLLVNRSLPLAEIALQSGFADQSHLTRVFKLATGRTPGAWRRSWSGN